MSNLSEKPAHPPSGNMPRSMHKRREEGIVQTLHTDLRQKPPIFICVQGKNQEEQKTDTKRNASGINLMSLQHILKRLFFLQFQYNISPYLRRVFLSYDANN